MDEPVADQPETPATPAAAEQRHAPFRPRHTVAQKVVLGVNIVIVIACLAGAFALLYGKHALDNTLAAPGIDLSTTIASGDGTVPVITSGATSSTGVPETFPQADPGALNFLISGSDANACVDPNSPWAGAADPARENIGNRSDTIMVLRLHPATHQAAVLSFPRDLWVPIPGKGKNRINSAYVQGDSRLLAQTIYDNFGVKTDHYLQVDFCAFKLIVDAVGGVAVPFSTPIRDKNVGLDIARPGCHTFSGDEALAYVRSRHLKWVDANGVAHEDRFSDFGRISRQQDFLRRTLSAALKKGVFDPAVARALIESMQKYIVRDEGLLSLNEMLKFAGVLRDIDPKSITTYQIEATGLVVSGNQVLEPKIKGENMQAILAIFRGEASLASAPVQVFESTTTSAPRTTTSSTARTTSTTSTSVPGTTTTVVGPTENVKGDIVPDPNVTC